MYPGIQSIKHFEETFYGDLLSLNCNQSETDFVVSGLNTLETPLQVTWEVTGQQLKKENGTVVDGLFNEADTLCQPYLICGFTSCLEIANNRQISLIN